MLQFFWQMKAYTETQISVLPSLCNKTSPFMAETRPILLKEDREPKKTTHGSRIEVA